MKYWWTIADNLSKAGWSWGCVSAVDSRGRTMFVADVHRGDGKRFVVRGDEKLTAFLELEAAIRKPQRTLETGEHDTDSVRGNPLCLGLLNVVKTSVDTIFRWEAGW